MRKFVSLVVMVLFCMAPVALLASQSARSPGNLVPGSGGSVSSYPRGIANTGFGLVNSGDVVDLASSVPLALTALPTHPVWKPMPRCSSSLPIALLRTLFTLLPIQR